MTIKELRNITGLSQSQFAKKYHIGIRKLQSWEQGVRNESEGVNYLLERAVRSDYPDKFEMR